jgi:predicted nucleic acid-binding Zn ribbon protein
MGNMLRDYNIEEKYNESRLIGDWKDIMGPAIASRTTRLFIRDRVLHIQVNSAPLRQEMSMSRDIILQRLEEAAGKRIVDDVRIYH